MHLKRLVGKATFAASLLLILSGVPATLAAPATTPAPTPAAGGPNYTHQLTEYLPMSAALCAQMKATFPTQASDPTLCQFIHHAEWTDMQPLPAGAVAPQASQASRGKAAPGMAMALSCPSGTASYYDYQESPFRWEMHMNTTFAWYGNCAPPTLTYFSHGIGYTIGTDITNVQAYQYTYPTTNPNRRAAVYSGHIIEHEAPGIDYTYDTWQRRECFNTGSSSCYWTWN